MKDLYTTLIDTELIMYTFLAVGKRTAYVILLSYFVSRVVISIGRFNDKEVKYIHWYITVSFAYQVGSEHVHIYSLNIPSMILFLI